MAFCLSRVFTCFVLCCIFLVVNASLSGLYIDNGLDQTIIQRGMTRRERMLVEHEILDLLGLPSRPLKARNVPLNKSAPIFLLDVYKSLAEENEARPTRSSKMMLSGEDLQAIDQSDVIMTFQSKNHHGAGLRHEKGRRLWFDVSEAPVGESIFNAELRLFQYANNSYDQEEIFTISAHKIVSVGNQGNLELDLISATNTTASYEGWIEINITDVFTEWVAFPNDNNGLYLEVHQHSRPGHEIRPDEIGIVSTKGEDDKQPFMVAFLKASVNLNERVVSRKKRQAKKHKKNHYTQDSYPRDPISGLYSQWPSRICKIQTLYVSFKDLEWQDWIIAPDGYGAFYCSGECNFPLNAHMNATNHAIVQTLVHLQKPSEVPKPCCAPTKLTAISVLFFLDDSNVILKKYKNMVVKSCGCH